MRKALIGFAAFLFWTLGAFAQSTAVTGTITDSSGQVWVIGSYTVTFYTNGTVGPYFLNGVPFNPATFFSGALNSSGVLSLNVPDVNFITPKGTLWRFTVSPAASAVGFSTNIAVTGASMNVSSLIIPPPVQVNASSFNQAAAYSDTEIVGATLGFTYYNLLDNTLHVCTGLVPCTWAGTGGGGTNILPTNNIFTGTNTFNNNVTVTGTTLLAGPNVFQGNACFGGPSPWIDITCPTYGARAVNSIPQTTATMAATSSTVSLAAPAGFQNGDWVVIRQAGASTAVSTPSAPTVTPVVAAGAIGANRDANLSSVGNSSSYSYCLRAVTPIEGLTACSTFGSTSTGAATLGATTVNLTSVTRTNNQLAIVMSAPIQTAVNGIIFLTSTTDSTMNNVWCRVNTWTDNQHFTCLQGLDTRAGATTAAASGGTATSYVGNKITLPTLPTGAYQYALYGRSGGTLSFISFILPGATTFTDFGSPFMDNQFAPDWMPATSTGAALAGDCSSQILSGAGTTTLTLVNPCTNGVSGATVKFDDGPPIQAASITSVTSGTSGTLNIPAAAVAGNGFYPINSHITLSCANIQQNAAIQLYSTVDINGGGCTWKGTGGSSLATPQFSWTNGPLVEVFSAFPGINANGGSTVFDRLIFETWTGGLALEFNGFNNFNDTVTNSSFVVNALNSSVQDYVGIGVRLFASSQVVFTEDFFGAAGPSAPSTGLTLAPIVLSSSGGGNFICTSCYSDYRGFAFDDTTQVNNTVQFRGSYIQAGINPYVSFAGSNTQVTFDGFTVDTGSEPVVANWNATLSLKMYNSPTIATNAVTGDPIAPLQFDFNGSVSLPGQDTNTIKIATASVRNPVFNPFTGGSQGLYNSADYSFRGMVHFPTGSEWMFDSTPSAPVSGSATSGSSFLTPGTNWSFEMTATDFQGGESAPSAASNVCVTTIGNEICPLTATAIQGAVAYSFYALNGLGGSASLSGCRNLTTPTCNAGASGSLDGSTLPPTGNAFALTGSLTSALWSPNLVVVGALSGNISFVGTVSGTFSANRTFTLPDSNGMLCTTATCTGGSGANTSLSNLITTSINQSLLPATSGGENLGSSGLPWGTLFVNTLQVGSTSGSGTLNVGTSGSASQNILQIHGDSAASNAGGGCLGLFTSPSDTLKVFLNASAESGFFVTTGSCAGADSTNILSPVGIPNYQSGTGAGAYTIATTDRGNKVVFPSAPTAAATWTMPLASNAQGASFPPGFKFQAVNQNSSFSVTINATSPNTFITSAGTPSSVTIAPNSSLEVQVDQNGNLFAASGGGGSGTVPAGSLGSIQLYATSTTLAAATNFDYQISSNVFDLPSAVTMLFHDTSGSTLINDGVGNLNYSGNFGAAGLTTNGTGAGADYFTNGTAPSFSIANTVYLYAPTSIATSYGISLPTAAATGIGHYTNSSGAVAMTIGGIVVADFITATGTPSSSTCYSGANSWVTCSGGGSSALSSITAATTTNTINNGNNAQRWNFSVTTNSTSGFTFGENTAGTATSAFLVNINTANTSTVNPFVVTAQGAANGIEVTTAGLLQAIGSGNFAIGSTAHGVLISEGATTAVATTTAGTSGFCFLSNGASADPSFQSCPGGSGIALSAITAATAANTIANGNNSAQIWNWALTSNNSVAMTFGETTAAAGTGTNYILKAVTIGGSTATPFNATNSLTGSQTLPTLAITPTWNTTGVVDAALLINATNTASGAASLLADFQIGGTSQWKVDKAGNVTQLGSLSTGTPPSCTVGTGGVWCATEGTGPTAASGVDDMWADSTFHDWASQVNGGGKKLFLQSGPSPVKSTGLTASVSTATLCASSAGACNQAGEYHVHFAVYQSGTACTANTTNGVSVQLTWTDANGTAHSAQTLPMDIGAGILGTAGVMPWNATTLGAWGSIDINIDSNGSVIQYATTYANCTTGTATYALDGAAVRIQ